MNRLEALQLGCHNTCMNLNEIAVELGKSGYCICPNFISPEKLSEIRFDISNIQKENGFKRASVGNKDKKTLIETRHDETHWLNKDKANDIQKYILAQFEELKTTLNRTLFLNLNEFETHYAIYPKDGFYGKHVDSFQNDSRRTVSTVLYLNKEWQKGDGGELRIYNKDKTHIDIQPIGGTLVTFLSRESEHEVLPCNFIRFSLAGWFKQS